MAKNIDNTQYEVYAFLNSIKIVASMTSVATNPRKTTGTTETWLTLEIVLLQTYRDFSELYHIMVYQLRVKSNAADGLRIRVPISVQQ